MKRLSVFILILGLVSTHIYSGTDFSGRGNEPFWNVLIKSDGSVKFTKMGGAEWEFTEFKQTSVSENVTSYSAITPKAEIKIEAIKEECTDNMSGEKFQYRVIVLLRLGRSARWEEYQGCGKFMPDPDLNGNWLIKSLNGNDISAEQTFNNKKPKIVINSEEGSFSGNAGCNTFFGGFINNGSTISFNRMASTQMFCPDMTTEKDLMKLLSDGEFSYKTENNELRFMNRDGNTVLILVRE